MSFAVCVSSLARQGWESECGNLGSAFHLEDHVARVKPAVLRNANAAYEGIVKAKVHVHTVPAGVCVSLAACRVQGKGGGKGKDHGAKGKGSGKSKDHKREAPAAAERDSKKSRSFCHFACVGWRWCVPLVCGRTEHVQCHSCGKYGHYSNKCPNASSKY